MCRTVLSCGYKRIDHQQFNVPVQYAVAPWLVRSSLDRAVRVRKAGDIVLCSGARHLTLAVPLSTQVYKWVPANVKLGVTLRWTSIPSRGDRILPIASCYGNRAPALWAAQLVYRLWLPTSSTFRNNSLQKWTISDALSNTPLNVQLLNLLTGRQPATIRPFFYCVRNF